MDELPQFSQVVYCYSDCAERFQIYSRLGDESRALAVMARSYMLIPCCLSTFWEQSKPLCLGMDSGGRHQIEQLAPQRLLGAAQVAARLGPVDSQAHVCGLGEQLGGGERPFPASSTTRLRRVAADFPTAVAPVHVGAGLHSGGCGCR